MKNLMKLVTAPLLAFMLLLTIAIPTYAFTVGVTQQNASPIAIVDESGVSLSVTNGLPVTLVSGSWNTIINGTLAVAVANTPVAFAGVETITSNCYIQAHESNIGTVVLGGAGVVASEGSRTGLALLPFMNQEINGDLQLWYINAENAGDKVNYYCLRSI